MRMGRPGIKGLGMFLIVVTLSTTIAVLNAKAGRVDEGIGKPPLFQESQVFLSEAEAVNYANNLPRHRKVADFFSTYQMGVPASAPNGFDLRSRWVVLTQETEESSLKNSWQFREGTIEEVLDFATDHSEQIIEWHVSFWSEASQGTRYVLFWQSGNGEKAHFRAIGPFDSETSALDTVNNFSPRERAGAHLLFSSLHLGSQVQSNWYVVSRSLKGAGPDIRWEILDCGYDREEVLMAANQLGENYQIYVSSSEREYGATK